MNKCNPDPPACNCRRLWNGDPARACERYDPAPLNGSHPPCGRCGHSRACHIDARRTTEEDTGDHTGQ